MKKLRAASEEAISYNLLFPGQIQRSQKTKFHILEAAIESYVTVGIEKTTFDRLAVNAGVTRPLVMRYFPDRDELFKLVIQFIRENLQQMAIQAMAKQTSPTSILKAYVQSTFDWIEQFPKHAKVWLLFYYYCGIRSDLLKINSELVVAGHQRITLLIEAGKKQGTFKVKDASICAKNIQNLITGSLLSRLTEKDVSLLVTSDHVTKECLKILGA